MVTLDQEGETSSYETLRANAIEMLREDGVQEKLASLVASYMAVVQPIIIEATVQEAGIRPASLENEIYSCFHHIARGLCVATKKEESEREIDKGESTHLKRVLLDSYKIALTPCLKEYRFIIEDLYHLSLDKDFNPDIYGAEPIKQIRDILKIKSDVKEAYQRAKLNEALGNSEEAIAAYEAALIGCGKLRIAINNLMEKDVYAVAKAHAERKRAEIEKEREENRRRFRITIGIASISSVGAILAAGAAFLAWLFPRG